ncbi:MAG TPA: hypothetical protein VMZ02_07990 [Candidatus Limnocylindrales bacterium]|nr:hypothetical protein [Candidatus Limnocylindrales bacterium]
METNFVVAAQAGIQFFLPLQHKRRWMPACAGMTDNGFTGTQWVSITAK